MFVYVREGVVLFRGRGLWMDIFLFFYRYKFLTYSCKDTRDLKYCLLDYILKIMLCKPPPRV